MDIKGFKEVLLLACCFSAMMFPSNSKPDQEEATTLLAFKEGADAHNVLVYSLQANCCTWKGVQSMNGSVIKYQVQNSNLQGIFSENTLSNLFQLRIIDLSNNSLSGPIPDLSSLKNLKSLLLKNNQFSGAFPPFILILDKLLALTLSKNNFYGTLPFELIGLKHLIMLNLSFNHFSGSFPPLDQQSLKVLDVSYNNLSGALPWTETISRFVPYSFSNNTYLCGEIIHKECPDHPNHHHHSHVGLIVAIFIIIFAIIGIATFTIIMIKKNKKSGGLRITFK